MLCWLGDQLAEKKRLLEEGRHEHQTSISDLERKHVQEKDRLIEQLKRNIKLSKTQEIEVELTVYIDECLRLRQQLEQTLMEKNMLL